MDWILGIAHALEYIEEHITDETDYETIARCAYSSSFHFQRMFSAVCDYTVGDYIRFRRLTLAGSELALGNEKIIDVALKYGYSSPESFSRAFTKFHGVTPKEAKAGATIKSFSRLSVKVIINGGNKMEYRFEQKESFDVIVKKKRFSKNREICGKEIPQFWQDCQKDGSIKRICNYINKDNIFKDAIIGIGLEYVPNEEDFPYGIGCHYNGMPVEDKDLEVVTLPKSTYVVFPCKGKMPEAFGKVYKYIFEEFFPNSEYKPSGVEIEAYPSDDIMSDDYYWELWLSVSKK